MEHRKIGSLSVSLSGLGCNNFGIRLDQARTDEVVHAALDAGVTFFDTADVYGGARSEELLGHALAGRRSSAVIATKFGLALDDKITGGADPAYIARAVEDSLRRLGTDYIDLYQLHRPDPKVPIADTLLALERLVKAGKVREIGASNFTVAQIREADAGSVRFASVQNEYSLLNRGVEEDGVLAELELRGKGLLPYFPLASGLLSGKYANGKTPGGTRLTEANSRTADRFLTDERRERADRLAAFAEQRGHSLLELAFSWLASKRVIPSIIAGATSVAQVRANASALSWKLSADELAELDRL